MKKKILVLIVGILLIGVNLYAAGDLQVNGSIGLGTVPNTGVKLDLVSTDLTGVVVNSSVTDPAMTALNAASLTVTVDGVAADGVYTGFSNRAVHVGDNSTVVRMIGGDNVLQLNSTTSGTTTVSSGAALRARLSNSNNVARNYSFTNDLSVISVVYGFNNTTGGGSVTASSLNGIKINAPSGSTLSVPSVAGLWINQQASGTSNNYGIVLDGSGSGADITFGFYDDGSNSGRPRIYAQNGQLYARDYLGNQTLTSPHDPVTGEWIYYSKNTKTGVIKRVNMEKLVKAVEKLTGETFMIETYE